VGKSTLEQLAQHQPAHLYFTGRNQSAAEQVISFVKDTQPSTSITFIQMDLSSLASVKLAVAQFAHDRLDILICNGGIMDVPPAVSVDGFEIHMATNHLGHALLIDKLLPVMLKTVSLPQADVRIAILSSAGFALHPKDGLAWDKLSSAQSGFVESMTRYGYVTQKHSRHQDSNIFTFFLEANNAFAPRAAKVNLQTLYMRPNLHDDILKYSVFLSTRGLLPQT
jgi:NAD(P)-dependent dehydrogenase (short-subunit alcohol dehydrogenase family)